MFYIVKLPRKKDKNKKQQLKRRRQLSELNKKQKSEGRKPTIMHVSILVRNMLTFGMRIHTILLKLGLH